MSALTHTYGLKCRLAPIHRPEEYAHQQRHRGHDQDSDTDIVPPLYPHFFYSSPIPIDNPLSTSAVIASDARHKSPLRPFSQADNNALERAWLTFASERDNKTHLASLRRRSLSSDLVAANSSILRRIVQRLTATHIDKHAREIQSQDQTTAAAASSTDNAFQGIDLPVCCPELALDVSTELSNSFCGVARRRQSMLNQHKVIQQVLLRLRHLRTASNSAPFPTGRLKSSSLSTDRPRVTSLTREMAASGKRRYSAEELGNMDSGPDRPVGAALLSPPTLSSRETRNGPGELKTAQVATPSGIPIPIRPPPIDDGLSGKPFVRSGTENLGAQSQSSSYAQSPLRSVADATGPETTDEDPPQTSHHHGEDGMISEQASGDSDGTDGRSASLVEVPVGISRLHMVSLPVLHMKPIYWSPVNDVATVFRATWFYRDSMEPVDAPVANQLEAGYRELRPYTETWLDELRSALVIGPLGEEKLSHPLWPKEPVPGRKEPNIPEMPISSDTYCAARCSSGEAASEGTLNLTLPTGNQTQPSPPAPAPARKAYANHHVIYRDHTTAFLLKPSLKPSAYYGRRPVAKIMKGMTIGIPVVRGAFDRRSWDHIHRSTGLYATVAPRQAAASAASQSDESTGQAVCPACKADKERGQVTDLVLVAHGIGQKIAERVESFHFTHAINAFRRAINIEMGTQAVQSVLRDGQNGIMVLPVNWRHTLSFEDGGPMTDENKDETAQENFTLKDIEPDSIPAVRSMISDVMFDIPFYMSQHKPKMISALVAEANRVYRLWCKNNPGFSEHGRVHLIAHSLGSAMAIEVLSKQPTYVPKLDLTVVQPALTQFEFDTTNLFLLGSPAGFFLLLERGNLIPRKDRQKPGADRADTTADGVVAEAGRFGCLAVDNVYNILAREDPIAYELGGTIDPLYSSSLRRAFVPSASLTLFQSLGATMRSFIPGVAPSAEVAAPATAKPPTIRLPSQLELEVHDFTREEVAERKAFLLNDNGQVDYYLRSGGGPLEIQYLNMLSAHTSYWTNQDLIRLLCVEIGRTPGRASTIPDMRAIKAARRAIAGSR